MDRKEFETLATRLRPRLIEMACRCLGNHDDADDVAQDTLLKLWSMKSRLDEYKSIDALAIVIGRHLCLDRLKRAKTQPLDESGLDGEYRRTWQSGRFEFRSGPRFVGLRQCVAGGTGYPPLYRNI